MHGNILLVLHQLAKGIFFCFGWNGVYVFYPDFSGPLYRSLGMTSLSAGSQFTVYSSSMGSHLASSCSSSVGSPLLSEQR